MISPYANSAATIAYKEVIPESPSSLLVDNQFTATRPQDIWVEMLKSLTKYFYLKFKNKSYILQCLES